MVGGGIEGETMSTRLHHPDVVAHFSDPVVVARLRDQHAIALLHTEPSQPTAEVGHLVAEHAVGGGAAATEDGDAVRGMRVDDVREIHVDGPLCRIPMLLTGHRPARGTVQNRSSEMMPAARMARSSRPRVSVVAGRIRPGYRCGGAGYRRGCRVTGLVAPGPRSPSASGVSVT